jgi:hypothetical protein
MSLTQLNKMKKEIDMETHRVTCFVHKSTYGESLQVFNVDMSEYGYLLIGEHAFDYTIPEDFNPVKAELATLNKKLQSLTEDFNDKVRLIEQRKNDLLSIEYQQVDEDGFTF